MFMRQQTCRTVVVLLTCLIASCGGGGGGDRAALPEPPPPAAAPEPGGIADGPPVPYADAEVLLASITSVKIDTAGQPIVDFLVTDGDNLPIIDVGESNVRFIIAKLQNSSLGNLHGVWQSYINRIEQPGVGPGKVPRLQATAERGNVGELTNNGDGTYRYRFAQTITDLSAFDPEIVSQAESEGLDLSYDAGLTHRVSIQFGGGQDAVNPSHDFQPATGAVTGIRRAQIVATATCNRCHENLAIHGGGRIEMDYCVTCHNPGSTDANSTNSMAFDEMVHKIHYGAELPSVQAGGVYQVYGFRDSLHDYSNVHYPRDHRECTACHAGSGDADSYAVATPNGENWREFPTRSACGACHDDLDFGLHYGGQSNDDQCRGCHSLGGVAGSVTESHFNAVRAATGSYRFDILDVQNTGPGEQPTIDLQVVNPRNNDEPYDILNDEPFVQGGGASRIAASIAWSTTDYTNTGNDDPEASAVVFDVLSSAENIGDNVFRVTSPVAIPDGSTEPFVAATGSGAATIEGHPAEVTDSAVVRIPVANVLTYFSIDEPGDVPTPRREITDLSLCLNCHDTVSLHGANRTDNLQACATCHNPRNTDREVREIALVPPTDGKDEESLDFKTMIHAIHAAGFRESPLQIVGFRGFSTHVYDENTVHYPAPLGNCRSCHIGESFDLPLAGAVLGTTVDTGDDHNSPVDDVVVSPASAVCASCHDSADSIAHMEMYGGDFSTSQLFIDNGTTTEQCTDCHSPGGFSDISEAHGLSGPDD